MIVIVVVLDFELTCDGFGMLFSWIASARTSDIGISCTWACKMWLTWYDGQAPS